MSPEPVGVAPEDTPPQRDLTAHPRVSAVLETLALHHIRPDLRQLPDAVRTARAAADALGVTPAEIANSLVFVSVAPDGRSAPLLVLASGGHRVDTAKVAGLLGLSSVEQADPDFVREHTGMAIGGVAPIGHPTRIRTVVDASLGRYDTVWAAAGHSHTVFATTYEELLRITFGQSMDVA
ncbi:YbaK/EbsC family protein [Phycicoccus avicenniae]|uniref:YbaK/EbsC family protein n=1 Tax=Phycicoccus avicenniae TaxID=2828860 RepID=UPI003D26C301